MTAPPESNERIAHNEAAYRELNDTIREGGGGRFGRLMLVCECGDENCTESMNLKVSDYESVRAHPRRFIVLPGHEIEQAENVVGEVGGLTVVEKLEDTGPIAEERDPRPSGEDP